ncbi:type II CAAX endopeptidase family protein [Serpentinicella sp. ANB-PHB4]|uniref:type II CAAX endopeptidase family protein n=1 Tax=Serpentinicella sp. ANB-PHB4 TaxID=3074076 RepID=UPI002857102F|nr:type II CAAX endopeptidase family protein [Serpentinicella sp. ANB-PHB4]MDR5659564.1 type II CAAX endopeptidase family protein [Serpentinicella sp. ANB-PHB4]
MEKKLKVLDGNILYVISALIFLFIGMFLHFEDERIGLIMIQVFVVLIPPIIYLKLKGLSVKKIMRFNKLRGKHSFLIVCITILMYPAAMLGNMLLLIILSLFGELHPPQIPTAENVGEYVILMLIVSITAGICEEVFFRGFMLRAYESIGKRKAIIFTAVLFGMFHFNLYNLFGPIVLGLVFGYLVYLTNSIYAGIIGHIVNNGFAMTLAFAINVFSSNTQGDIVAEPEISVTLSLIVTFIFFSIIASFTGYLAYQLIKTIKKDLAHELNKEFEVVEKKTRFWEFTPLLIVIFIFAFVSSFQIRQILNML